MMGNKFMWILFLGLILENSHSYEDDCKNEARCKVFRTHGMRAADCYDKKFRTFPKCVSSDIEVLELSFNRIRKVSKSDLNRYKYLKFLYLTDNMISNLDDETFKDMDTISTLDLSLNGLARLPPTIFQLPSLKTLYLSQNVNINIVDAVQEVKPISSPLTVLDISLTTDEDSPPPEFPDFGPMPLLATLNITRNQYVEMTPKHFAGLCNLQMLININVTIEYNDNCDCWVINNWLKERSVQFTPFRCRDREASCLDKAVSEEDKKIYNQCRDMYDQIQKSQRLSKIGIGVGITIAVVILVSCVCIFWVRRKRRNNKKPKKVDETTPTQPDGLMLLNNQTKAYPPN